MIDFALVGRTRASTVVARRHLRGLPAALRPIMMTTMCALISGLPLMLGHGAGSGAASAARLRDGRRADPVAGPDAVHDAGDLPVPRRRAPLVRPKRKEAKACDRKSEPARRPAAAGPESTIRDVTEHDAVMKILVVEDELKMARLSDRRGLTEQGYTVDEAHDGIDGQHLALEFDYDVIVLDVMLPGLRTASRCCARLRARAAPATRRSSC